MNENESSPAPPENGGAEVTELQILNGGIEIEVVKIDGGQEKVKVRQLPISVLGEWGRNQGGEAEAYLVELLCDKVDRTTVHHLQNALMIEMRVQQILMQAPVEQIEPIEKRLTAIREEIAKHQAKPRWSDTLTHESVAKIRELGERLNKKNTSNRSRGQRRLRRRSWKRCRRTQRNRTRPRRRCHPPHLRARRNRQLLPGAMRAHLPRASAGKIAGEAGRPRDRLRRGDPLRHGNELCGDHPGHTGSDRRPAPETAFA